MQAAIASQHIPFVSVPSTYFRPISPLLSLEVFHNELKWNLHSFVLEKKCTCHFQEQIIERFTYHGNLSDPVSWTKPNISCPHKFQIHHIKVEPDIKSPHSFPVGFNKIKNIFKLYGGLEKSCDITVYVRYCKVNGKYHFYNDLIFKNSQKVIAYFFLLLHISLTSSYLRTKQFHAVTYFICVKLTSLGF